MNFLTAHNLKVGYNGKAVVSLPALTLEQGQKCLIRGDSGSGKTTLLHTLAGFSAPFSGSITINGTDIYQLAESARDQFRGRTIGVVFQTLYLLKNLTVIDNLLLSAYVTNQPQNRAHAVSLLAYLGISDLENCKASEISQGQAQRVAIARAVMHSPSLILSDEPTSSLDDPSCIQTMELLSALAKKTGAMLLVSSHDTRIQPFFDNIIVLEG